MSQYLRSYIKYFGKMRVTHPLRVLLLRLFGSPVTKEGWEDRILIINLEAMGDLVMFTSVLKHYRKNFPGKKIVLVIKEGTGMDSVLAGRFVDEVIPLAYRSFAMKPLYGMRFISRLRAIGFSKVIAHDFSAAEIMSKVIATSIGAREVIGYQGQEIEFEVPYDIQQVRNLSIVRQRFFPKFTSIIPTIRQDIARTGRLPSQIEHYITIFETVTGVKEEEYATELPSEGNPREEMLQITSELRTGTYVIMNINASVPCKRWPMSRFREVARFLHKEDLTVVLIGAKNEREIAERFAAMASVPVVNLVGKTSFSDLLDLVLKSAFVVTNDTSTVHIAIALKKPSVCVIGGGQFGVAVNYGYSDINLWVWKKTKCFFDNWHCGRMVPWGEPSPCVERVTVPMVLETLRGLREYLSVSGDYPKELFFPAFREDIPRYVAAVASKKRLKIVYAGIQSEYYNEKRFPSFEYVNFYEMLASLPDVEVVEYPYDPIRRFGKKAWNERLLALIEEEKPDLFVAFMFTDELDHKTLDTIKAKTISIGWFADDHWRIHDYSRWYASHFTWAVTTWSKGPEVYRDYGVTNVIRSQWACNPNTFRPEEAVRDIDVAFVGQRTSSRARVIQELQTKGIKVYVRGWGWPEGRINERDMVKLFSRSKINLNLNITPDIWRMKFLGKLFFRRSVRGIVPDVTHIVDNVRLWKSIEIPQIKARPFEILGCKTFLISGYADDMSRYYEDGKETVYYNGTVKDLAEKIQYYLAHDEERERIAHAGYERTLRDHTYEKRFKELFEKIGVIANNANVGK